MIKYHKWKIQVTNIMVKLINCCEGKYIQVFRDDCYQLFNREEAFLNDIKYSKRRLRKFRKLIVHITEELEIPLDPEIEEM